jgi:hypothetical protein
MNDSVNDSVHDHPARRLQCGTVLRVREDECEVLTGDGLCTARYASTFPSPRTERVSPGHLVALTTTSDGTDAVLWRWYDAVVLGAEDDAVRLWEPAHGEVLAQPRTSAVLAHPGGRAYLSAGLPGADWWVAGPTAARAEDADVELDEVQKLYTEHGLWDSVG